MSDDGSVAQMERPSSQKQIDYAWRPLPVVPPFLSESKRRTVGRNWVIFLGHVRGGLSYAEIALVWGLSPERIRQIVAAEDRRWCHWVRLQG